VVDEMKALPKKTAKDWIGILAVIALAAYLRLNLIGYTEFKADEADAAFQTMAAVREGVMPDAAWTTSVGIAPPPLIEYLLIPPALITAEPAQLSAYVAVFNVAGVLLCYMFMSRFFGRRAGIFSSLLFAVNPWAVLYSRKLWPQDFLPTFTLLFMYCIFEWGARRRREYLAPATVCLTCLWPLHLTTLAMALIPPAVWLILRPPTDYRHVLVGLAASALLFLPYIYHEYETDFSGFAFEAGKPTDWKAAIAYGLTMPVNMATTRGLAASLGGDYKDFRKSAPDIPLLDFAAEAILIFGACLLIAGLRTKPAYLILSLWLAMPIVVTFACQMMGTPTYPHYFLLLMPLQYMLIGLAFDSAVSSFSGKRDRVLAAATILLLLSLAAYQAVDTMRFQEFVSGRENVKGDYGMPLEYRIEWLRDAAKGNMTPQIDGYGNDAADRYLLKYVIKGGS
jgi:hypothetical protein